MVFPIVKPFFPLVYRPFLNKVTGLDNLPQKTGAILAANHASYLDHFIIGCRIVVEIDKMIYFLAKKEHFDTFIQRTWHKYLRAIPIDRDKGGEEAIKEALKHLRKGHLIMIYPEGTRSLDGNLSKARTGIAKLALHSRAPVVPIGLTDTFNILPKGKNFPNFKVKTNMNIGKPLYFEKYYDKEITKEVLRQVTNNIMREISNLSKKSYNYY